MKLNLPTDQALINEVAKILSNEFRTDDRGQPEPYFRSFQAFKFDAIRDWLAEPFEDGWLEQPSGESVESGSNLGVRRLVNLNGYEVVEAGQEFTIRGDSIVFILRGAVLLYFSSKLPPSMAKERGQRGGRRSKAVPSGMEDSMANGKLRFAGDVLGEFRGFVLDTPLPVRANVHYLAVATDGPTWILQVPLGKLRSDSAISREVLHNLPRSIVTKTRRDELFAARQYGLKDAVWYVALILHLLCQFGHPAFTPEELFEMDGDIREAAKWMIDVRVSLTTKMLACIASKREHAASQLSSLHLRSMGVALVETETTRRGTDGESTFFRACLGAGSPDRVEELRRCLRGKLDSSERTFKTCIVYLPALLNPSLFALLRRLAPNVETTDEEERRGALYEFVKLARLTLVHPSRYIIDYEDSPTSPEERSHADMLAIWEHHCKVTSARPITRKAALIEPDCPVTLSEAFLRGAKANGSFHVRHQA